MNEKELLQMIVTDLQEMKLDMQSMKADMQSMKAEIQEMKSDIRNLNEKVDYLTFKVENELSHNIQIVAEGHLDLNRKLEDATRASYERELCALRVNHIDMELWKVKRELKIA